MTKVQLASAIAGAMLMATSSSALTFDWSFDVIGAGTNDPGGVVTGTLSGLSEGDNYVSDLTGFQIDVLSSPTNQFLGGDWVFDAEMVPTKLAFTVTGGEVAYANAKFRSSGNPTFLPILQIERASSEYGNQLYGIGKNWYSLRDDTDAVFTSADETGIPPVPLPAALPMFLAALGGLGLMRNRRRN